MHPPHLTTIKPHSSGSSPPNPSSHDPEALAINTALPLTFILPQVYRDIVILDFHFFVRPLLSSI